MILVTGATGLNGTALVERLSGKGIPVRALVRDRRNAAIFRGEQPAPKI